jgi:argininosuccinate lyase
MSPAITGRLAAAPDRLLHEEVLEPQFRFEVEHLLPHYVALEQVLLLEYLRMGLLDEAQAAAIGGLLDEVDAAALRADPETNLSDISLAVERYVTGRLTIEAPAWHVDRSRNDLQATAQLLYGRAELLAAAELLVALAETTLRTAAELTELPMPGYTHLQAAQVISPGFYLSAVAGQALFALRRLVAAHDDVNRCPMGAGAMSGQELGWDRDRIAGLVACAGPQPHALTAVASRDWAGVLTGELSSFALTMSRFTTDLMAWGGEAYGYLELPDAFAGISAAMPQKKNYPVLERVRGRAGHVVTLAHELTVVTRNTTYSNSVEVGKEASRHLAELFRSFSSAVTLLTAVLAEVRFRADRMRAACAASYTGGMALANELTLGAGIPWRTAQVVAGEYIAAALDAGRPPHDVDGALLTAAATKHGYSVTDPEPLLRGAFDVDAALRRYSSPGSAHPGAVRALLAEQTDELTRVTAELAERGQAARDYPRRVRDLLAAETA